MNYIVYISGKEAEIVKDVVSVEINPDGIIRFIDNNDKVVLGIIKTKLEYFKPLDK